MTIRTYPVYDMDDARELHAEFMEGCTFPGEDHSYWMLRGVGIGAPPLAMCSAVYRPEKCYVYLSSAGVHADVLGLGLQRRMIRNRCAWGKSQGATHAVTYALLDNYPSIVNLLRCGFKFAPEPRGWAGVGYQVHYFEKEL